MRSKRRNEFKLSKLKFYSNNEQVVVQSKEKEAEEEVDQGDGQAATL